MTTHGNGSNKAHPHPFGSTVIPGGGFMPEFARNLGPPPNLPGAASPETGALGVAGAPSFTVHGDPEPRSSSVANAFDALIDAIADRVADKVIAKLDDTTRPAQSNVPPGESVDAQSPAGAVVPLDAMAAQLHVDLEQALRERVHVKIRRYAPDPIIFNVRTSSYEPDHRWREVTAYARPFGQGYTDGARVAEYVLICDGKALTWERRFRPNKLGFHYSELPGALNGGSFTFQRVLDLVDGTLRGVDAMLDEFGVIVYEITSDATV